jgi:hypothetical protein
MIATVSSDAFYQGKLSFFSVTNKPCSRQSNWRWRLARRARRIS